MRNKAAIAITLVTLVLAATSVFAQSSKAAWRFKELIALSQSADTDPSTPTPAANETGWVNILRTHIKTPNAKELAIGVSLQCGLLTDTTVRSKGGELDTSAAQARIRVRVKITQPDGSFVFAEPNNGLFLTDILPIPPDPDRATGISYCDRYQRLEARFAGLNCTADEEGVVTCTDPETLRLLLKTLDANHFNFLHANAVPGVQMVEVQAKAAAGVALGGTRLGEAGAEAFVGAGALYVETIRLVKTLTEQPTSTTYTRLILPRWTLMCPTRRCQPSSTGLQYTLPSPRDLATIRVANART
jgi:hypothetical protein